MTDYAPIILFTYNRPSHTKQVLDALALNSEAKDSLLYIFCDGAKKNGDIATIAKIKDVQTICKNENRFKEVIVRIQDKNLGLANSVITGVSEVVNKHAKVIVMEDDIVVSDGFLRFMNQALDFYKDKRDVMHISGYMYPHNKVLPETFFYNVPLCWGWATWNRAWNYFESDAMFLWKELDNKKLISSLDKFGGDYLSSQLAHNISGKLSTWFIKWHASILLQNGYTLYPNKSFVENIGFDGTGVHNGTTNRFSHKELLSQINIESIELQENLLGGSIVKDFYQKPILPLLKKNNFSWKKRIKDVIRNYFFKVFPDLKETVKQQNELIQQVHNNNSYLGNHIKVYSPSRLNRSIIGNYTYIAQNAIINNTIIGKFCSIGPNLLCGWGMHPTHGVSTHPMFYSALKQNGMTLSTTDKIQETKRIVIGNDVFIGMNVTVLDGVTIGDGAIIGAGAVVSKNIPPYAIAVGNPIRVIKYRFEPEIIEKMQALQWWDRDLEDLNIVEKYFFEVEQFLLELESKIKL